MFVRSCFVVVKRSFDPRKAFMNLDSILKARNLLISTLIILGVICQNQNQEDSKKSFKFQQIAKDRIEFR